MAAIAYPQPRDTRRRSGSHLRLVEPYQRRRRRQPSRAVYRRRRLLALLLVVGVVLLARATFAWLGGGPLTASEPNSLSAPTAGAEYVVQPGDSLWTLARRIQPEGDVRDLVNRAPLSAGERIALPAVD
jgi:hypothetical protein